MIFQSTQLASCPFLCIDQHSSHANDSSTAKRANESTFGRIFWANYLLLAHVLEYGIITAAMILWVPQNPLRIDGNDWESGVSFIKSSDITSIITAGLVAVKIITTSWSGLVAWCCVFLLMEKGDIDIRRLNWTISHKLPRPIEISNWFRCCGSRKNEETREARRYHRYVVVVLLLMWPATMSASLLTSALDWETRYFDVPEKLYTVQDENGLASDLSFTSWHDYLEISQLRRVLVYQAANAFEEMKAAELPADKCRLYVRPGFVSTVNVQDLTYPCIDVGQIQWIKTQDPVDFNMYQRIFASKRISYVTGNTFTMASGQATQVQLIDTEWFPQWPSDRKRYLENIYCEDVAVDLNGVDDRLSMMRYSNYRLAKNESSRDCEARRLPVFPEATQFKVSRTIVVPAGRTELTPNGYMSPQFNSNVPGWGSDNMKGSAFFTAANGRITLGKIEMMAGVMKGVGGGELINTPDIPNMPKSNLYDVKRSPQLDPDNWVNQTLSLLPDVLYEIATNNFNLYQLGFYSDVQDFFTASIRLAYSATWVTLNDAFNRTGYHNVQYQNATGPYSIRSMPVMWARVKTERVYAWLGLNMLLTLSGIIHLWFERKGSRTTIVDTAAVALTTDASSLLKDKDVAALNWRNMSYLKKEDVFVKGKDADSDGRILLKLKLKQKLPGSDGEFELCRK